MHISWKSWIVAALVCAACSKPAQISVGTCGPSSESCGIKVARDGEPVYELACTPPDTKLPMECHCVQNGTKKKKVELDQTLPKSGEDAETLMRSVCGF